MFYRIEVWLITQVPLAENPRNIAGLFQLTRQDDLFSW